MESVERPLTWPWAGQPPEDERELEFGTWPYAVALAGRRAANGMTAGLRYRIFKEDGQWLVRRTSARPRRGVRRLRFEQFIDPKRVAPPDIDLTVDDTPEQRDELFRWLQGRFA